MLGVVSGRAAAILRSTETYPTLADLCKIGILYILYNTRIMHLLVEYEYTGTYLYYM
jgi:hypothetical protein